MKAVICLLLILSFTSLSFSQCNQASAAQGDGLQRDYYNNVDLSGTRVAWNKAHDISNNWGSNSPLPGIVNADAFSIRLSGSVQPRYSGIYTFSTLSDDGVRVWVNNQLIINDWNGHAATWNSGQISLNAGQWYDFKVEYFDGWGGAELSIYWSHSCFSQEQIPYTQFWPTGPSSAPGPSASGHCSNTAGRFLYDTNNGGTLFGPSLSSDSGLHLSSPNCLYGLYIHGDGNVCIYNSVWSTVWCSGAWGSTANAPYRLTMQADGNLVVYDKNNSPVWWSGTNGVGSGRGHYRIDLRDDGKLMMFTDDGYTVWMN